MNIHSFKIGGIAVVDVLLTLLAALVLSKIGKKPFWIVLILLFLLGILMHRIFKVRTTVDRFLFPE